MLPPAQLTQHPSSAATAVITFVNEAQHRLNKYAFRYGLRVVRIRVRCAATSRYIRWRIPSNLFFRTTTTTNTAPLPPTTPHQHQQQQQHSNNSDKTPGAYMLPN
ncbi:hypothetical protein CF335_g9006 [Tilletia laevis]|nr:hypothetical protein CF335_g9006 [Tilletia laevis]